MSDFEIELRAALCEAYADLGLSGSLAAAGLAATAVERLALAAASQGLSLDEVAAKAWPDKLPRARARARQRLARASPQLTQLCELALAAGVDPGSLFSP